MPEDQADDEARGVDDAEHEESALSADTIAAVEASQAHAEDLLAAARELLERFPHLAYHLAVLALEELGRGVLLVIRDGVTEEAERRALSEGMEDHEAKLFWALWSPTSSEPLTATQIDEFRVLARRIHEERKAGLYFNPSADALPREAITADEARQVIALGEARVGMDKNRRWAPKGSKQVEDIVWFGGVLRDQPLRDFVFGSASIARLNELRSVPKWVRWLREQVEESERRAEQSARDELARERPQGGKALEPKWRMTFRVYSDSHSIRARPLNLWNDANEWVKLRQARSDELIVDLTMPKAVLAGAVWPASYSLAQRLLLALNISTFGFFWWQRREHLTRFYERLEDVERGEDVVVERAGPLTVSWGEHQVLDDRAIRRSLLCFAMLPTAAGELADEAFGHYLRGLALIAKTDVHLQFDANVFEEFLLALQAGWGPTEAGTSRNRSRRSSKRSWSGSRRTRRVASVTSTQ